ncbi:predicted protein [Ostreococcus lucimarinus CCE9901]|jgi:hypothetical protein|uniref:DUF1995 domain-containing protein n=1 Tax=Ostreococcus lucimarinus (strain CCE9901) TaxID=436017 RepID=A4RUQ8_OSTLU|nr:predicted protein [Ostreococcus lucimarinus CCE9901]ABO95295.1 predicted protein [Ostreococcus lucimarinus CCE9901]|eukprot:XP_001417002.1 predicted protein [Ostreococcus lucimarinus CCE9901]
MRATTPRVAPGVAPARDGRRRGVARRVVARAAGADEAAAPPRGKSEAYDQARVAVERALEKSTKRATKRRRSSGRAVGKPARLAVELPVNDDSDAALIEMATGTLGDGARDATAVFGRASAAKLAREMGSAMECVSVDDAWTAADAAARDGIIALVGVPSDRVEAAMRKCRAGEGRPTVCVNVEWEHDGDGGLAWSMSRQQAGVDDAAPSDVEAFANSFVVVYSFLPLNIQASMFASSLEGAVFKCVRGGAPAGTPWRILVKEKGAFAQVGAMQRRPQQTDLEAALYNSIAAKSPVNEAVGKASGFFRGLMNKDK